MKKNWTKRLLLIACLMSALFLSAPEVIKAQNDHGFRFIRIQVDDTYTSSYYSGRSRRGGWGRGGGEPGWIHDYPTSEDNLYEALDKTTEIKLAGQYLILTFRDERIFEYPFLYLSEPGRWRINQTEVDYLREYFARGGFIMFDDFRGTGEWANFYYNMKLVFPDKEPVELPNDHQIWSIYYDIDPWEAPSWVSGGYGKYDDKYYAYYDDDGRMMCIVCFNQDVGDGWEWPNRLRVDQVNTLPFQMGINFIIYALTH